ncbi:hypothetical protein FJY94_06565 [Candidatus Kaiserbacteria bacterium]|nr:hypothetical protein [Candidatus Kaiserbacteria bacterium]
MKKYVELRSDFDPGQGGEYSASRYPGPGLYYLNRTQNTYFVHNGVVLSIFGHEPSSAQSVVGVPASIPESTVVKLLAVALHTSAAQIAISH